jgi:hypothetical protein
MFVHWLLFRPNPQSLCLQSVSLQEATIGVIGLHKVPRKTVPGLNLDNGRVIDSSCVTGCHTTDNIEIRLNKLRSVMASDSVHRLPAGFSSLVKYFCDCALVLSSRLDGPVRTGLTHYWRGAPQQDGCYTGAPICGLSAGEGQRQRQLPLVLYTPILADVIQGICCLFTFKPSASHYYAFFYAGLNCKNYKCRIFFSFCSFSFFTNSCTHSTALSRGRECLCSSPPISAFTVVLDKYGK